MAYDPTVWKSGDTITSAKLNKLENGLAEASGGGTGGGVLVVNDNNGTLDKTWKEISDAFDAGMLVHVYINEDGNLVKIILNMTITNNVDMFGVLVNSDTYDTDTENGYPRLK